MIKCKYCNSEYATHNGFMKHCVRTHKLTKEQIITDHYHNGIRPVCKCGCGEYTKLVSGAETGYFGIYLRGHISRIHNNWGHNQKAIDKSTETRREQFKNGDRTVWNEGLTKETDNRVKQYGKAVSIAFTSKRKKEYSNRLSDNRLNGTVPTRWGIESANWKGGTSSITNIIRANQRLYTDWIYPILIEHKFTCQTCGDTNKLEVHHDKESMSEIILKFIDKTKEYNFDEKRDIANKVIDYHIKNKISGKTLCKKCHRKLHPSYNI